MILVTLEQARVKLSSTHWGRMTHIWVCKLDIIVKDNGFSPVRRRAISWTNAGILFNRPLGTHYLEILIKISTFSFKKMRLKISSSKWWLFCLGLNVLMSWMSWCLIELQQSCGYRPFGGHKDCPNITMHVGRYAYFDFLAYSDAIRWISHHYLVYKCSCSTP